jgi:DNA-binding transcriptional ArsR family regulator
MTDACLLFKALADPGRRKLMDRLHAHDGQTLSEVCQHLDKRDLTKAVRRTANLERR